MPRVSAVWKEKMGRRHVWKVDEVMGGIQRRCVTLAHLQSEISRSTRSIVDFPEIRMRFVKVRKTISQGQSERSGLRRCYVVCCVWKQS